MQNTRALNQESGLSDCHACGRLASFLTRNRKLYPDHRNEPVASFGCPPVELAVVGLAPGLHGANRTGIPFCGDYAGNILYPALIRHGFAKGSFPQTQTEPLSLVKTLIVNVVRCVPPQNKPTTEEIRSCAHRWLFPALESLVNLRVILALGRIAHGGVLKWRNISEKKMPFAHGRRHVLSETLILFDSYHTSRYNLNTRRLTPLMFEEVITAVRKALPPGC